MAFKFHRGDHLQDVVTGFKGAVMARQDNLTSCNALQPAIDKDGKHVDGQWFDEHRLEYDPARLGQKVTLERTADQPPG